MKLSRADRRLLDALPLEFSLIDDKRAEQQNENTQDEGGEVTDSALEAASAPDTPREKAAIIPRQWSST